MTALVGGIAGAVIGSAFGPLGTAIGFSLGAAVGQSFDPPKIEGPRINDRKLQGSSFGAPIPIVYGSDRLAGTVIYKTDLEEHANTEGGKGGGPEVTTYTYSASYAILICEGPIIGIRKMWANGRLVRDGSGLGADLPIVIYLGDETQMPDPTMEADKGVGEVSAHRGTAYVMFTDHFLTEFGNIIPNWEFEVSTAGSAAGEDNCPIVSTYRAELSLSNRPADGWAAQVGPPGITDDVPYITAMAVYGETETPTEPTVTTIPYSVHDVSWTAGAFGPDIDHGARIAYLGPILGSHYVWVQTGRPFIGFGLETTERNALFPIVTPQEFTLGWGGEPAAIFKNDINCSGVTPDGMTLDKGQYSSTAGYRFFYTAQAGYDRTGAGCIAPPPADGIPIGAGITGYVHAVVGSHGNSRIFVMTGPDAYTGSPGITEWHEMQGGVVARSGTVSPTLSVLDFGFGPYVQYQYYNYSCAEAESNGRYIWAFYGAGATPANAVALYWIDDAGNLAIVCSKVGLTTPADGASFLSGAISAFTPGKCVVVAYKHFEIFERGGSDNKGDGTTEKITLASIVANISERNAFGNAPGMTSSQYDVSQLIDLVTGYKVTQTMEKRAAIQSLMPYYFFDVVDSDNVAKFVKRTGASVATIPDEDLAARMDGSDLPPLVVIPHTQEDDLPRMVSVSYINQATDYQPGLQMAQQQSGNASRDIILQAAIVLTDEEAKRIADALLAAAWVERDRCSFATTRKYIGLEPTDVVTVSDRQIRLTQRVEEATGVIRWEGLSNHAAIWTQAAPPGDTGGGFIPPDSPTLHVTELHMLNIPLVTDGGPAWGVYAAMADNAGAGWPGATIFVSIDDGVTWQNTGIASTQADTFGRASTILGDFGGGNIFDELNSVTVVLAPGAGTLSSASELLVLAGANTAMLGDEMIQYKTATLTAASTYKLTGLLRGRRGTEWAMPYHSGNEFFCSVPTKVTLPHTQADLGRRYLYRAVTSGNTVEQAINVPLTNTGLAKRPYSPVQLGGGRNAAGDIILNWTRREITGGQWLDYTDVPAPAGGWTFEVYIYSNSGYGTLLSTISQAYAVGATLTYTLTAAAQTTLFGSPQATLYWAVADMGGVVPGMKARAAT